MVKVETFTSKQLKVETSYFYGVVNIITPLI